MNIIEHFIQLIKMFLNVCFISILFGRFFLLFDFIFGDQKNLKSLNSIISSSISKSISISKRSNDFIFDIVSRGRVISVKRL